MVPIIKGIDHVVITVTNIFRSCRWYENMLGMKVETFISPSDPNKKRYALILNDQKINLHEIGMKVNPMAKCPQPGSVDLCFWTDQPVSSILKHWQQQIQKLKDDSNDELLKNIEGPLLLENNQHIVQRTGARGLLKSIYIYDPDGNLIEVSNRSTPSI
ncbi:Glyoxalase/Bleomycin resistance protein/Dihydroxybiphenyl dioxygenase [Cunninghamella echinulata]|nr:Glyoxalase/Bleomycin resistance protein/Dihydroxybiphenyl dioxygenase [Cunninghamella echinulata]